MDRRRRVGWWCRTSLEVGSRLGGDALAAGSGCSGSRRHAFEDRGDALRACSSRVLRFEGGGSVGELAEEGGVERLVVWDDDVVRVGSRVRARRLDGDVSIEADLNSAHLQRRIALGEADDRFDGFEGAVRGGEGVDGVRETSIRSRRRCARCRRPGGRGEGRWGVVGEAGEGESMGYDRTRSQDGALLVLDDCEKCISAMFRHGTREGRTCFDLPPDTIVFERRRRRSLRRDGQNDPKRPHEVSQLLPSVAPAAPDLLRHVVEEVHFLPLRLRSHRVRLVASHAYADRRRGERPAILLQRGADLPLDDDGGETQEARVGEESRVLVAAVREEGEGDHVEWDEGRRQGGEGRRGLRLHAS